MDPTGGPLIWGCPFWLYSMTWGEWHRANQSASRLDDYTAMSVLLHCQLHLSVTQECQLHGNISPTSLSDAESTNKYRDMSVARLGTDTGVKEMCSRFATQQRRVTLMYTPGMQHVVPWKRCRSRDVQTGTCSPPPVVTVRNKVCMFVI